MIKQELFHIKILLKRLTILLLLYAVCRILFLIFNRGLFPPLTFGSFLNVMWIGVRYDISSIIILNSVFILFHIIPNPYREKAWYQRVLKILFYFTNGIALIFETGDFIYYQFGLERTSTHELGLTHDTSVLPQVFKDYWIVFFISFLLILCVEFLYRRTQFDPKIIKAKINNIINYRAQVIIMLIGLGLSFIGARGGIQPEFISPNSAAAEVEDNRLSELVINTPFSVIYAFAHRHLIGPEYFTDAQAKYFYNIQHNNVTNYKSANAGNNQQKQNVCVIVLESFGKEYIGYFNNGKGYTPFLDSLLKQGLTYTNAYSNGKSSNQGITAVTASIPVLMEEPFISSLYGKNSFYGIGTLLKKIGYSSYFFHGANNGSMNFDVFMKQAGMDGYFGRNEYGNDADFDGNWGIFDEPFLKWTANKMTTLQAPFFSEIFTISSHHPFTVPKEHTGQFKKGPIPMLEVVGYADYALQQFFSEAKKQPWYNNTLFILTADHPGPPIPNDQFYQNQVGAHSTWMLLYKPDGQFKGTSDMVVQQTDIMPTVLDYLGYTDKYTAFGYSVFDTIVPRYAFNYLASTYMILDDNFVLQYTGEQVTGLYEYKTDSLLTDNVMYEYPTITNSLENTLKALIQQHHEAMIGNKLVPQ